MPGEESTDHARRILAVDVREVSLVDRAANLRKFLVVKKLEGDDMGLFVDERSQNMDPVEKAKKAEDEMTDEEKAKKAAEEKAAKEKKEAEEKAAKEAAEKAECEAKKAMNPAAVAGMLQGLKGAPKAAVDQLVGWLKEQASKKADGPGKDDPYPSPNVKKSILDEVLEAVLEKGAKQFTAARSEKIKEAAGALVKLLQEMDPEAAKSLMSESSAKEMPEGSGLPSSITKALAEAKAENAELKKRLDALENSRQAPKGDGKNGTDDKTVKKSLWDGVL